jgi:hypothetical protein
MSEIADAGRGEGSVRPVLATLGTALLTVCSQTVRILLDAAAHVRGKPNGSDAHRRRRPYLVGQAGRVQIPASRPDLSRGV